MSTPPDRSTLANYAAAQNSQANRAQAGAVAVAGAIGTTIVRGAAAWLSSAVSTVAEHIPAARSATQYYTYDAAKASSAAYQKAKRTLAGVAGGAVRVTNWMGLDLSEATGFGGGDDSSYSSSSASAHGACAAGGGGGGRGRHGAGVNERGEPTSPLSAENGGVELLPGMFVHGESESHYTPKPTGLAGQVEISRVQVQLAPVFVTSPDLYSHSSTSSSSSATSSAAAAAAASFSAAAADNENAMLCLSLVGPGGYPGFAIFRVDCTDVFEEVVELSLTELEALGPVKSVCVAEVVAPASGSSSAAGHHHHHHSRTTARTSTAASPLVHQKIAVILTEKCILQYSMSQRRVVGFQSLAFEASDLMLSAYFALVVHSGFGQVSVLSLYDKSHRAVGCGGGGGGNTSRSGGAASSSVNTSGGTFTFALDEVDVLVPEGSEIALSDRWIATVGSGSDAARTSTRLLSYAQRTTSENISKNIHKGLATVGGFIGAAVAKALQVSGVSGSAGSNGSGDGGGSGGGGAATAASLLDDDGFAFNPRAIGAVPIDSSDKPIGTVVVRDLCSRTDIAAFVAHDNPIQKMAFDATGTILATCAVDGKHIHVFRICPRGTATRSTTVATAAAVLPRLPSSNSLMGGSSHSLYGLVQQGAPSSAVAAAAAAAQDDTSGDGTPITPQNTTFPGGASSSSSAGVNNNNNNNSSSSSSNNVLVNSANAPCTTVIFTHRIARGMTGSTVTSLSFSQPWSWLACTTTIGTAHFFRLDMDRLCNVEENIVAGESGLQPAVNVAGASYRIRSAPATSPPNPVVVFFPGEAATGAGEQTTACVVTRSATVATAVLSSVSDKGVVLYERGAAEFAGVRGASTASAAAAVFSGAPPPKHVAASAAVASAHNKAGGGGGRGGAGTDAVVGSRYMTAEAAWMELLHRRTQPAFMPLYEGIKVQPLPIPDDDEEEEDDS